MSSKKDSNWEVILTNEQLKIACVTIMENIIYTGINEEFKHIGSMHVLTALTVVSEDARQHLPWLYESINFIGL